MHKRGFTLIETLVVVFITTLIVGAIVYSILLVYRANDEIFSRAKITRSARVAIADMQKHLREADFSSDGAYPVVTFASSSVTFFADIDSDIDIERVTYRLDGTTIARDTTNPTGNPPTYAVAVDSTTVVSENIFNLDRGVPLLEYKDETGALVTNPAERQKVQFVTIRVISNESTAAENDFELRTSAALRNVVVR